MVAPMLANRRAWDTAALWEAIKSTGAFSWRPRLCLIAVGAPHALTQFAEAEKFEVVREFVEVETGKGADALDRRPQLKAALATTHYGNLSNVGTFSRSINHLRQIVHHSKSKGATKKGAIS
jgi:hypothetical protein